jgi:TRAP-type C4-dicarboxylate transport system permease small subunit
MSRIFGTLLARCEVVLFNAAVIATAIMMLLTSADAIGRYIFNSPVMGAYELTEKYLMVAAIFLGMSYAFRGGIFIRVTFLVDRLPRKA